MDNGILNNMFICKYLDAVYSLEMPSVNSLNLFTMLNKKYIDVFPFFNLFFLNTTFKSHSNLLLFLKKVDLRRKSFIGNKSSCLQKGLWTSFIKGIVFGTIVTFSTNARKCRLQNKFVVYVRLKKFMPNEILTWWN